MSSRVGGASRRNPTRSVTNPGVSSSAPATALVQPSDPAGEGRQPLDPQQGDADHCGDHHQADRRPRADIATHFDQQVHFDYGREKENQQPHDEEFRKVETEGWRLDAAKASRSRDG